MIKLITFVFVFASMTQAAEGGPIIQSPTNSLEIKLQDEKVTVQLPKTAFDILMKWNPEFVIFNRSDYSKSILDLFKDMGENQLPMAFIEDLEGNGKKDIVLLGSDLNKQYVVAILQREKKWTLLKIAEWSIKNIKETVITSTAATSSTVAVKETGVPLYILPAIGEQGEKLKGMKKIGIQVETYMGPADVYEITNYKPVKFSL